MTLTLPLTVLLGLIGAGCVVLLAWGLRMMISETQVAADERITPEHTKKKDETFILHHVTEMLGRPFQSSIRSWVSPELERAIQTRVEAAGHPDGLTTERYLARKPGEVILYGGAAILLLAVGEPLLAVACLAFIAMTDVTLIAAARKRQDQIQQQLPDFLDVLAVTVGSGLSFRQALSRVCDSMPGVLADEFRLTLRQMELGISRREAFRELRTRNSNEALGRFVSALQQAEELGSPLADALMNISSDTRRSDAQYMRRKAQKLNPRIVGVTAVTMLPGLLILIGGGMFLGMNVDLGSFGV